MKLGNFSYHSGKQNSIHLCGINEKVHFHGRIYLQKYVQLRFIDKQLNSSCMLSHWVLKEFYFCQLSCFHGSKLRCEDADPLLGDNLQQAAVDDLKLLENLLANNFPTLLYENAINHCVCVEASDIFTCISFYFSFFIFLVEKY